MKAQKTVSSILIGLGCIILTIGLVAFLLPRIDNYQLQLVLSSFQEPSDNWFVSHFNAGMNFAMDNYLSLLLIGAAVMLLGIVLLMSVRNEEAARAHRQRHRSHHTVPDNPYARPRTESAALRHIEETGNNPFARYVNTSAIPKSTGRDAEEPAPKAEPQPVPEKQPESPQAENPFVMHAYQPSKALQRKPFILAEDDTDEEEPLFHKPLPQLRSDSREAPRNTLEDDEEPLAETPVFRPASVASVRPVIRSTFHATTFDQPQGEIVPDTTPAAKEEPIEEIPPVPQPGSRIRSTMGRKR